MPYKREMPTTVYLFISTDKTKTCAEKKQAEQTRGR